jgi:hypothetical protein
MGLRIIEKSSQSSPFKPDLFLYMIILVTNIRGPEISHPTSATPSKIPSFRNSQQGKILASFTRYRDIPFLLRLSKHSSKINLMQIYTAQLYIWGT